MRKFEKLGFPHCARAIDGSHIPIITPKDIPEDYFNRKGWYSVLLQGLVDGCRCLTDLCVGWPGSVHDARMFGNLALYRRGEAGNLFPPWHRRLNGVDVSEMASLPIFPEFFSIFTLFRLLNFPLNILIVHISLILTFPFISDYSIKKLAKHSDQETLSYDVIGTESPTVSV